MAKLPWEDLKEAKAAIDGYFARNHMEPWPPVKTRKQAEAQVRLFLKNLSRQRPNDWDSMAKAWGIPWKVIVWHRYGHLSVHIPFWFVDEVLRDLGGSEFKVLTVLARHAHFGKSTEEKRHGETFVTTETIAKKTGLSIPRVDAIIRKLMDKYQVEHIKYGEGKIAYRLVAFMDVDEWMWDGADDDTDANE
jgi:hypothetical protein